MIVKFLKKDSFFLELEYQSIVILIYTFLVLNKMVDFKYNQLKYKQNEIKASIVYSVHRALKDYDICSFYLCECDFVFVVIEAISDSAIPIIVRGHREGFNLIIL